jgi:helicase
MRNVIIVGVHRGLTEIEPLDIKQEAGRAGRVGLDERGDAYILLPDSKFTRFKLWCENIPPIKSTMNNQGTLAFHIVSEISEGEIYNIPTLIDWYNRSLAAFQNNMLDVIEAQTILDNLEKVKILEKKGDNYKVTNLGRTAAHLYFDPYTIAGWYMNFNKIFQLNFDDHTKEDNAISWAIANIRENSQFYIPKEYMESVKEYKRRLNLNGLTTNDGASFKGLCVEACLSFSDVVNEKAKSDIKFNVDRMIPALERIDKQCAFWDKGDYWQKMQMRIQYEVTWEQTELCSLTGIGSVRVRDLFQNDIKTLRQLKQNYKTAARVLGLKIFNDIVLKNRLDIPTLDSNEYKEIIENA